MAYPLVGRAEELALLHDAVDAATRGAGTFIVIEGAPGAGKSRLLQEATAYARSVGVDVHEAAADELDRGRPFAAIDAATRAGPLGAEDVAVVETYTERVEDLCAAAPVLLVLEDVHWADHATLQALRAIARRVQQFPLVVVVTLRPLPSSPDLDVALADFRDRGAAFLSVDSVTEEDAAALAAAILGAPVGPQIREQLRAAGGNPFYVVQLVEALAADGSITVHSGTADVDQPFVPSSLRQTILHRLASLPEPTRDLLKVASILGGSFSLAELAAFTQRQAVELLPVLTGALRAGVVGDKDGRLAFRHDLVRQAMYEELPASVARDLHREAGRSLALAGAPAVSVAEQMWLAALPGDSEAVDWLRRAAHEADAASAVIATRFLRRALDLAEQSDPRRPAMLADLALSLLASGRLEDAHAAAQEALTLEPDVAATQGVRHTLATIVFMKGDRGAALEMFAPPDDDTVDPELSLDLALGALAATYSGQHERAVRLGERARVACAASGDAFALSRALMSLSLVRRMHGHVHEAVALGTEATHVAAQAATPLARLYLHPALALATAHLDADRLADGESVMREFGDGIRWTGRLDLVWFHGYLAAKGFMAGEWDAAVAEAEAALARGAEIDFPLYAAALLPHGLIAAVAFARGDLARTESALTAAMQEIARSGPQPGVDVVAWVQALVAEASGRDQEALAALELVWAAYGPLGYQVGHRWLGPDLVRLAVGLGMTDRAASVVAQMDELAARARVPSATGAALRCRGLLADDPGVLVAAVEAYRAGPRLFDRALACEDAAAALGRAGKLDDARRLRQEALAVFEQVGAVGAAARGDARLRAVGVSGGRPGRPRRAVLTGWESLTPAERTVARLVADGLTNRAIAEQLGISTRTAETHVAHAFTKLNITSRAALAAAARERPASQPERA